MKPFTYLTILFVCCSAPKNEDREFDRIFKEYTEALNNQDYYKVTKFLPQQTFEKITKKEFVKYFKDSEQKIGLMKIVDYKILNYGKIITDRDSSFRKIDYQSTVINYSNRNEIDSNIFKHLEKVYGDNNIEYDSIKSNYTIHQRTDLILMKSKESDWVFLEYSNRKENKLIKRIVPSYILDKL